MDEVIGDYEVVESEYEWSIIAPSTSANATSSLCRP